MKKLHSITIILFVITSLTLFVFCSCAPYAKINELEPKMSIKETEKLLGPPSGVHSNSSFLANGAFLSCKLYHYSYLDSDYYLLFTNDSLFCWGTSLEGIENSLKAQLAAKSTNRNIPDSTDVDTESKRVTPSPKREYSIPQTLNNDFRLLEGTLIVADDGQFLGVITTNKFNSDSITNEYGKYGSQYNSNSIFNKYGNYGSEYSSLSPFNKYTSTPPKICDGNGNFIAYLTANRYLTPRVDPLLLIAWLKSNS